MSGPTALVALGLWVLAACGESPPPEHPPFPYSLQLSTAASRSASLLLDGRQVSGNIYVFAAPEDRLVEVAFYLDDPELSRGPRWVEKNPPFDFAGGVVTTATPLDTRTVVNGPHTISALLFFEDGLRANLEAAFTVFN